MEITMPYEIRTNAFYSDVIEWLQENVGDLLWHRAIVEWRGRGWTVNNIGLNLGNGVKCEYLIRVDDPKLAVLAMLRWSNTQ